MFHGRKRLITALTGSVALVAVGLVPMTPAQAEPDIDDVKASVDRLYHSAEQASERYNDVKIELDELDKDLRSLRSDERRQDQRLEGVRAQVEDSIVRQYEGEGISTVGRVVVAEDPGTFLGQLATMSAFNDMQSHLFDDYSLELDALDIRREATEQRANEVAKLKAKLGAEKAAIDKNVAEAESLLSKLEDEERERLAVASRAGAGRLPTAAPSAAPAAAPSAPASGRAAAAVNYALAQVGDAYVYGAAGPSAFDCSGLTMMAWAQAGVSLPHSSGGQMGSGAPVSSSALQPGDLVFYYSPVSHVGIYVGNGMIVHAANPSTGVSTAGVHSMPYSGAVRPG